MQPVLPLPVQPAPAPAKLNEVMQILQRYYQDRFAQGIAEPFNSRRLGTANALQEDIQQFADPDPRNQPSKNFIKQALPYARAEVAYAQQMQQYQQQQQQQQGAPAQPGSPQQQPGSPQQQPAPAPLNPPAIVPAGARQLSAEQQAFADAGGTRGALQQAPLLPVPSLNQQQQQTVWDTYTALEELDGAVIPPTDANALRLFRALPQDFQEQMRRPQPDGSFDLSAEDASRDDLVPWIQRIQQIRVAWGQQNNAQANTLYGLGNQEFLRGSGILDTLSGWASQAGDAVSGWFNTVADNMPTMSDVRRATSRIVPDRFQDYIPSGLQRTFTDKAKDFFGFGRGGLEERKRLAEFARGAPRVVDMSQGRRERENAMPYIMEFDPKAEFLKRRGEVLSGGVYDGLNNNINDVIPYEMYGGNVDYDDAEEMTPFKRRIGMPNPFSRVHPPIHVRPALASNALDVDESLIPFSDIFGSLRQGHAREMEKPKDMDEDPDPIRITNENYKIFTGKQKAPKYKISS